MPGPFEHRDEAAVLADQRLVRPARDEDPLGDGGRLGRGTRATNWRTGRHSGSGRGRQPVPAPANEPDWSSSRPKKPGARHAADSDATAPKLAPDRGTARPASPTSGSSASNAGTSSAREVLGVARIVGVLDEPLHRAGRRRRPPAGCSPPWIRLSSTVAADGVAQVVAAVVDDQQRVARARRRSSNPAGRYTDVVVVRPSAALSQLELDEPPGGHVRVAHRPSRLGVARGLAHRVGAERVRRATVGLSGSSTRCGAEAVGDLELVLEAATRRGTSRASSHQSESAIGSKREIVREADAEVDQPHRDHRAAEGERAARRRRRSGTARRRRGGRRARPSCSVRGGSTRSTTGRRSSRVDLHGAADVVEHPAQRRRSPGGACGPRRWPCTRPRPAGSACPAAAGGRR